MQKIRKIKKLMKSSVSSISFFRVRPLLLSPAGAKRHIRFLDILLVTRHGRKRMYLFHAITIAKPPT
ncbi:hypothetical protein, partial [Blautia faecicola]|uniref:hypothetical protein n=1 Tax=Blautia faecicola TaxID=2509240 RepID=UPI001A9AC9F4